MVRPIMKWAGGKSRLADTISESFGGVCRGTYYEPFVGSAAVYLHRRAAGTVQRAVLADANPKLVAVHAAVRDHLDALLAALGKLPREDWRERYYDVREAYNDGPWDGPEHAARFVWLNRAGFNGLYRENRKGEFNVPVGRYAELRFPAVDHFRQVSELLQDAELRVADFRGILDAAGLHDQVYCDPPYVPITETANFVGYCGAFGMEDQHDLARASQRAARRGAQVVLSNHDLPTVRQDLYPKRDGFRHLHTPRVTRAISRRGASRGGVKEVIAAIGPRSA